MLIAPDVLRTARLIGRATTAQDLDYVIAMDSEWEVQRTLFGVLSTPEESKARLRRWQALWENHGFGFWIFEDARGCRVGHAGLFPSRHDAADVEVGYAFFPAFWGRGYATEATREILRTGFIALELSRIVAVALPENAASRRVMEKCGLGFERDLLDSDGKPCVRYAALRETWLLTDT